MKKVFSLLIVIVLMLGLFAGCAAPAAPAAPASSSAAAPASSSAAAPASSSAAAPASSSAAPAPAFAWDQAKGATITIDFVQHPWAQSMINQIDAFTKLTGINVKVSQTPEENYFDKLTTELSSKSGTPDIFMTGAYQVWDYAPPGFIEPLEGYISDPTKTSSDFNFNDFSAGLIDSLKWDCKIGDPLGTGSLWALPMGFEQYCLSYNTRIFKEKGIAGPPKTVDEFLAVSKALKEFNGPNTYGVAVRGTQSWATIHPGYMSMYATYGAKDFVNNNGKLESAVNSPEAVACTQMWIQMLLDSGPPAWTTYTNTQCMNDLGAGKCAMMLDGDVTAYFGSQPGAAPEAANIAYAPNPLPQGKTEVSSNVYIWAISINSASKNKLAAWLFLQYMNMPQSVLNGALDKQGNLLNTVRASVAANPQYQQILQSCPGYIDTFNTTVKNAKNQFTPQPHFVEVTTAWATTLQKLWEGKDASTQAVQSAMDQLKQQIDGITAE